MVTPSTKKKWKDAAKTGGKIAGEVAIIGLLCYGGYALARAIFSGGSKPQDKNLDAKTKAYVDSTEFWNANKELLEAKGKYQALEKQLSQDLILADISHVKAIKDSLELLRQNFNEIERRIISEYGSMYPSNGYVTTAPKDTSIWGYWQGDVVTGDTTTTKPAMEY